MSAGDGEPPLVCYGTTYVPHDRTEMYETSPPRDTGADVDDGAFYRCPRCRRVVQHPRRGDG